MLDVAVTELSSHHQCPVCNAHTMEALVLLLDAPKDVDGVHGGRLGYNDLQKD